MIKFSFFSTQKSKEFEYKPRYFDADKAARDEKRGYILGEDVDEETRLRTRLRRSFDRNRGRRDLKRSSMVRVLLFVVIAALMIYLLYM